MADIVLDIVEDINSWGIDMQGMYNTFRNATEEDAIEIPINSYGGSVLDGNAFVNIIKGSKAKTTAKILGYAISMGTQVAIAADRVIMPSNGIFMMHNAWMVAAGDSKDMDKASNLLTTMNDMLVSAYMAKSGQSEAKIRELMDAESWLDAEDAVSLGFVDEIYDAVDIAASVDPTKYKNVPEALVNVSVENRTVMEQILSKVSGMKDSVKEFFDSQNEITNQINALEVERDEARNQLHELSNKHTELKDQVVELQSAADQVPVHLSTIETLNAEVERLKAKPAGEHTTSEENDDGEELSNKRPWENNPINKKAMDRYNSKK